MKNVNPRKDLVYKFSEDFCVVNSIDFDGSHTNSIFFFNFLAKKGKYAILNVQLRNGYIDLLRSPNLRGIRRFAEDK